MIKIIHSSYVPIRSELGENTAFVNEAIGLIIHPEAELGDGLTIVANTLIGGNGKPIYFSEKCKNVRLPKIGDYNWIENGSKVIGGVDIGAFSVIGPNAVVARSFPVGSIVADSPARLIREILPADSVKSRGYFSGLAHLSDSEFAKIFAEKYKQSEV